MPTFLDPVVFAAAMFIGMLACLELGRRERQRRIARDKGDADEGIGAVEGAVFTLFGLLLAFTFSGAAARFDHRRELITQEANAIGTAWLRIDLLPAAKQPALRALFRDYVQARLDTWHDVSDQAATAAAGARSAALQGRIWTASLAAADGVQPPVANLVVPALNDMFDITTARQAATQAHPPAAILLMLFALGMAASLLTGYELGASRTRRVFHTLAFVVAITATVYVIMDMEYPRLGLIRIDSADQVLRDVLHGMQ
jgi:hypothetical protein